MTYQYLVVKTHLLSKPSSSSSSSVPKAPRVEALRETGSSSSSRKEKTSKDPFLGKLAWKDFGIFVEFLKMVMLHFVVLLVILDDFTRLSKTLLKGAVSKDLIRYEFLNTSQKNLHPKKPLYKLIKHF